MGRPGLGVLILLTMLIMLTLHAGGARGPRERHACWACTLFGGRRAGGVRV